MKASRVMRVESTSSGICAGMVQGRQLPLVFVYPR